VYYDQDAKFFSPVGAFARTLRCSGFLGLIECAAGRNVALSFEGEAVPGLYVLQLHLSRQPPVDKLSQYVASTLTFQDSTIASRRGDLTSMSPEQFGTIQERLPSSSATLHRTCVRGLNYLRDYQRHVCGCRRVTYAWPLYMCHDDVVV
jgi:hypothetical protein